MKNFGIDIKGIRLKSYFSIRPVRAETGFLNSRRKVKWISGRTFYTNRMIPPVPSSPHVITMFAECRFNIPTSRSVSSASVQGMT